MAGQQLLQRGGVGGAGDGEHVHSVLRLERIGGASPAPVRGPDLEEAVAADSPGSWRTGGGVYGVADAADVSVSDVASSDEDFQDAGEGSGGSLDSLKVTMADLVVEEPSELRRQPAHSWTVSDGRVLC